MITIIVCCDQNYLIGDGDTLPWHYAEDLKFFKETTINNTIIMGRKTWDSLPRKPLKNRFNIIMSRNFDDSREVLSHEDVAYAADIDMALYWHNKFNKGKEIYIIGGSQIYNLFLETGIVDQIIMTKLNKAFKAANPVYFIIPQQLATITEESCDEVIRKTDDFSILRINVK